jgi:hypothetical protein
MSTAKIFGLVLGLIIKFAVNVGYVYLCLLTIKYLGWSY